ncbi:MAG: 50S ribosomal protein L1 [Candidatus Micrarchaeota archaeon]|nr:50S ribosomal protein L1 [Candidatus Micrarchaeota archaeon]
MINDESLKQAISKALEDKGTRKFVQTVEMAVNFKNIDLSKQENRLNLEVLLPKGRGKNINLVVFADGNVAADAKAAGAEFVISSDQISKYKKSDIKRLAKNSEFFAQPQLMVIIGKNFGQVLGGRGKIPKPLVGNIASMLRNARNTVKIRSRGKFLPVVHCPIGTENMSVEDLTENAKAVLNAIKNKVGGDSAIKSVVIKLSMGKPVKIE